MSDTSARLAIVVKCWPRLSETFVAQELAALERDGLAFDIWSLRHPTSDKQHPLHRQVKAAIHYLPEYLRDERARVIRCWLKAFRFAGFFRAHRVWLNDLRRDPSRNRIRRFGQACVMAAELPDNTPALYAHFLHTPSSVARYTAIMRGLPWSFSAHAKDIWTTPEWELSEKLNADSHGAKFGVSCTRNGVDYLNQVPQSSITVKLVYHGLDLSRFPAPPVRRQRSSPQTLQLLSVGRLVEKKGFDRLLDALALLPETLDWRWTHIGGGELGPALRARATGSGLDQRLHWRGECEQPEVIEAMREADVFLLPSRVASDGDRDGLPNVLMEAAGQKLAIISTPVSAIPEFIESGIHGLLTDDSPEALAQAIMALADEPALRQRLADAAYQRLVTDFTVDPGVRVLRQQLDQLSSDARR